MISCKVTGLEDFEKNVSISAGRLAQENATTLVRVLSDYRSKARQRAPFKTGALRRSIDYVVEPNAGLEANGRVGSDNPYARITELGGIIPAHTINATSRKVLASKSAATLAKYPDRVNSAGFVVFGKSVNIPAQHRTAKPYLFPILIENIERWTQEFRDAFNRTIEEGSNG